jgi:enoyl-CoA hydratase/carnithine racemase
MELKRILLPRQLSWQDIADLHRDVVAAVGDVLVLEGVPGVFCDGGALDAATSTEAAPLRFAALLRAIETSPRPVVALVDGSASGGGVGLAATADVVLATTRSTFGLPETVLGLIPAMVFPVVARRVGLGWARRMALGLTTLSAVEAAAAGLVDEVVDDLDTALARLERRLGRLDLAALGAMKSLIASHFETPAGYDAAAAGALNERLRDPRVAARIRRFVDGAAPWEEDKP